jgi:teichuronic acid biosynthesis glycosyltransferase TuaH
MDSILCISNVDWTCIFQRPQQLMLQMAKNNWHVTYCNKTQRADILFEQIESGIKICHNMRELLYYKPSYDIVWVYNPLYYSIKGCFNEKILIFDCTHLSSYLSEYHMDHYKAFDIIIVASDKIKDKFEGLPRVFTVKNGCNQSLLDFGNRKRQENIFYRSKNSIGYVGPLCHWVDYELLGRVCPRITECDFYMIGDRLERAMLPDVSNIHYLGYKTHEQLPKYLYSFDTLIIPFKDNETTRSVNPMMLYEYLATGKPIISIRLPWTFEFEDLIYTYSNDQQFIDNLNRALQEKNNLEIVNKRREIAQGNTWETRYKQISSIISGINS